MRKFYCKCLLLISMFMCNYIVAQTIDENVLLKVNEINKNISILKTLSPFTDDELGLIDSLSHLIIKELTTLFNDTAFKKHRCEIINNFAIKSKDNSLCIFSWYENTGGTTRLVINFISYTLPDGSLKGEILSSYSHIDDILELKSDSGAKKYLLLGTGTGGTRFMFSEVLLLSISDTALHEDFSFAIYYRPINFIDFNFDTTSFLLSYEVVADEYNSDFEDHGITDYEDDETAKVIKGSFVFNGHSFEEVNPNCKGLYIKGKKEGEWTCQEDEFYRENNSKRDDDYMLFIKSNYKNDLLHGIQKKYYPDGQIHSIKNYKQGELHAEAKEWYENGQMKLHFIYKNGTPTGVCKAWFPDGSKSIIFDYQKREFIEWQANAFPFKQLSFKNKTFIQWDMHGNRINEIIFTSDSSLIQFIENYFMNPEYFRHKHRMDRFKLIDGEVKWWHPNGNIKQEYIIKNHNPIGKKTEWYESGRKQSERIYEDGIVRATLWYDNESSQLWREYSINENGQKNGQFTEWYENGQIKADEIYLNNEWQSGKGWYQDGNIAYIKTFNGKNFTTKRWFNNGNRMEETNVMLSDSIFMYRIWYENGNPKKERFYRTIYVSEYDKEFNIKDSTETFWFENGQLGAISIYKRTNDWNIFNSTNIRYYETGIKRSEENFMITFKPVGGYTSIRNGQHTEWYANGMLKSDCEWKNHKKNGLCREWYENGQIKFKANYYENVSFGKVILWHPNGNKQSSCKRKIIDSDAKLEKYTISKYGSVMFIRTGKCISWYENGNKKKKEYFTRTGKRVDRKLKEWYENGQLKKKGPSYFKNGIKKEWHSNGQLLMKGKFKNGKRIGDWKYWHENGQLISHSRYKNGKHTLIMWWDEHGNLTRHEIFEDGKLIKKIK